MKEKIILKKKQVMKVLSRKEYFKYINFIGWVYKSDYDLKVFMARKFSNHYISFLDLAISENGGIVRREFDDMMIERRKKGKEKPITISNNALPFVKDLIKKGTIKRVLLLDDLVLHGRTLDSYYEKIKSWFEEVGIKDYTIDVRSYAKSLNSLINKESMRLLKAQEIFDDNDWRKTSNQIVDMFYLLGQPYTSYVPNYRIRYDSEEGHLINKIICEGRQDIKKTRYTCLTEDCVDIYTYNKAVESNLVTEFSIRLYDFAGQNEYVAVPMVTLKPLKTQVLFEIFDSYKQWIVSDELKDKIENIKKNIEYDEKSESDTIESVYRLVVYILSALYGWQVLSQKFNININEIKYDQKEEEYNFYGEVINYKKLTDQLIKKDIDEIFNFNKSFNEEEFNDECLKDKDISKLIDCYNSIEDEYKQKARIYSDNKGDGDYDFCRYRMERFLNSNGNLDEESYKESKYNPKHTIPRYNGVPVHWLMDSGLEDEKKDSQINSILFVVDLGKGSIVPKCWNGMVLPFLHAGEQNYQFYEEYYFPYIYGLYMIDKKRKLIKDENEENAKEKFTTEICKYWDDNEYLYYKKDIDHIKKLNIIKEYSSIISDKIKKYSNTKDCKYAFQVVNSIIYGQ